MESDLLPVLICLLDNYLTVIKCLNAKTDSFYGLKKVKIDMKSKMNINEEIKIENL